MNAAPVSAVALALASVIVRTDVVLGAMRDGLNAFVTVGRASTVSVADAPAAVPAFVVVTMPVELLYDPVLAEVTFTVTVHEPLAGTVPDASATLPPLFAAVTLPAPHVVAPLAAAVLTRFAGYVSVKAAPVTATAFGFVSVIVRVDVPPAAIVAGENAFAIAGCATTVSVAPAPAAVPEFVVVTFSLVCMGCGPCQTTLTTATKGSWSAGTRHPTADLNRPSD